MYACLIVLLVLMLSSFCGSCSQAPEEEWNRTFEGAKEDVGISVQQSSDDGYILAGKTQSYGGGDADAWLIKTDSEGHELWNRTFGEKKYDEGYSVQQTSDGGCIIAGTKGVDLWLIKLKPDQAISHEPPLRPPPAGPVGQPSGGEAPPQNATAVINLRNYDQDEIEVALYMDGESVGTQTLPPKSQQVQSIPVLSGDHTFLMEWKDPDTGEKVYQAENNATFQPGDVRKVNLKEPENRGTNAEVYVMNKYSRELEVFLDINESYQGSKIIPPGSYMRHFGTYPVPQGRSTFRIFWEDPNTGQAVWSESNQTFQEGETRAVKLVAAKKGPALEVTVRPAGLALEVGDNKNLDITINNTGDETAKLVDLILLSQNTQTAVLSTTSLLVGDLQPGQSWRETSFPPYVQALKEGETAVEVKARAEGLKEVTREVKVAVLEKGKLSFKEEDLGESAVIRQSDVVAGEAFGGSGDFPEMLEAVEGEIAESFSAKGIEAALAVQSAGKAGFAAKGQKLRATLAIANSNPYPVGVAAAIVLPPQDVFRYGEGSYYATIQSPLTSWYSPEEHYAITNLLTWPSRKMMESFEAAEEWTWRNFHGPLQLYYGGGVFILEPGYVMIFSSEITSQQSGYLDVQGEIYYTDEPMETYSYVEMFLPFARGGKGRQGGSGEAGARHPAPVCAGGGEEVPTGRAGMLLSSLWDDEMPSNRALMRKKCLAKPRCAQRLGMTDRRGNSLKAALGLMLLIPMLALGSQPPIEEWSKTVDVQCSDELRLVKQTCKAMPCHAWRSPATKPVVLTAL